MTKCAAMILCAGLGTRLRPLTDWLAKPMVPVGDRPAVDHVAARLRDDGELFETIVVNVHHRPDDLRAWAAEHQIHISDESDELLGTAGGLERAATLLGDGGDVLVWNGDILVDAPFRPRDLLDAHTARHADATLAIHPREAGEGNVGIDADGFVVRLRSESFGDVKEEARGGDFLGVHVLGQRLRARLPRAGCLVGDVYMPALRERGGAFRVRTHLVEQAFTDIGSVAAYVSANRAWLGSRESWIAEDATLSKSARVTGSIIGAGARVEADAIRSIVWPGTHVAVDVADAIVTPHGVVRTLTS